MIRTALVALGGLLASSAPASAQYYCAPNFGGGFSYRSSFSFSVGGPGYRFSTYSRGFYAAPIYAYGWVPPVGPGYGPGFGNPFFLPAPPFAPPIILPVGNVVPVNPMVEPVAPIVKGDFLVISPKQRVKEEGTISPMVDRVARPDAPPMFRFDPFAERRVLGLTENAIADPAAEAARQIRLARESLALGEYGSAAEHLDRARRLKPDDIATSFLTSQAQFAAGQYAEAVATIRAGMKAHAGWAAQDVKPQDLFGKPARFDGMIGDLKRSAEANPDAVALQFLFAHQLWFSGDRDTAKAVFERLAGRLKDADATGPFLKK